MTKTEAVLEALNPTEVLDQLKCLKVNHYPITAIKYVHNHPEVFTPIMLGVLDEALTTTPESLCDDDRYIFAMFTLAKCRNKEALSKVLQLVKINLDHTEIDFLGDLLTEAIPEIIAACFDGDLSKLDDCFCLDHWYGFTNVSSIALQYLIASKQIGVDEAISFMDRNIRKVLEQQQTQHEPEMHRFIDRALCDLAEYSLDACDRIIEETHWQLSEGWLGGKRELDYLKEQYAETNRLWYEDSLKENLRSFNNVVNKGILAVSSWFGDRPEEDKQDAEDKESFFHNDDCECPLHHFLTTIRNTSTLPLVNATKIGRNDPCSCGSGKKYKKCCLV